MYFTLRALTTVDLILLIAWFRDSKFALSCFNLYFFFSNSDLATLKIFALYLRVSEI